MLQNPGYVPIETAVEKGGNFVAILSYADIVAARTAVGAVVATLFSILGNAQGIELKSAQLITPFVSSDGTLVSAGLTIGDAGSANRLLATVELNAAGAFVNLAYGTGTKYAPTANTPVTATLTPTAGKDLATLTAGRIALYFEIRDARVLMGVN